MCAAGSFSSSSISSSPATVLSNVVSYNGRSYAALDGASPWDSSQQCQSGYIALPPGWSIAPDNADSIAVISSYRWGTHRMVLSDGASYWTLNTYTGQFGGSNMLTQRFWNGVVTFGVNGCNFRILITAELTPALTPGEPNNHSV